MGADDDAFVAADTDNSISGVSDAVELNAAVDNVDTLNEVTDTSSESDTGGGGSSGSDG